MLPSEFELYLIINPRIRVYYLTLTRPGLKLTALISVCQRRRRRRRRIQ